MKHKKIGIVLCSFAISLFAEYSPNLVIDKRLDSFIYRICTRYGVAAPVGIHSQPMNAGELAVFLERVDSLSENNLLSDRERLLYRRIRNRFLSEKSLFSWSRLDKDIAGYVHASVLGTIEPEYTDSAAVLLRGTLGPELRAHAGELSLYTNVNVSTEFISNHYFYASDFEPYRGIPHTLYGRADSSHARVFQTTRGGVSIQKRLMRFETVYDRIKTGPVSVTPLTFSAEAPEFPFFRWLLDLGPVRYTHVFGLLSLVKNKRKYLYTHRLDIPMKRLPVNLGITEAILNGSTAAAAQSDSLRSTYYGQEREWEWVYMIPFVPYAFVEPNLGDQDNAVLSFDISVLFPHAFRWYAELFLDDITTPWTLFSDDWGNKWALAVGGEYFGRLKNHDFDIGIEYARVEPWVYTHFYGGSHRYTHFDKIIGAQIGPNADKFRIDINAELVPALELGIFLENIRSNPSARGGKVEDVFQDEFQFPDNYDADTKTFLGNEYTRITSLGLQWQWNTYGRFYVDGVVKALMQDKGTDAALEFSGGFLF